VTERGSVCTVGLGQAGPKAGVRQVPPERAPTAQSGLTPACGIDRSAFFIVGMWIRRKSRYLGRGNPGAQGYRQNRPAVNRAAD
jgi:hypothetical protein